MALDLTAMDMTRLLAEMAFAANMAYQAHFDGDRDLAATAITVHRRFDAELERRIAEACAATGQPDLRDIPV